MTGDHRPRTAAERAARVRFRRALSLMAMTLVLPGSAQLVAGDKRVGRWGVRITLGLLAAAVLSGVTAYFWHGFGFWLATSPWVLTIVRIGLIALGIAWVALFVDAWRLGQPLSLQLRHRRWVVAVNGALAFSVAATLLFGAHLVGVQSNLVQAMFAGASTANATDGRYNVLLLGADSGKSRWGLRTDSMTVASIDADTGRTVLIGLPRNMTNFPFPKGSIMHKEYPHGYRCGIPDCELNSLSTYADNHKSLFNQYKQPGVEATTEGIEGITGLKISYWSMVNMEGFRQMADALGGVKINVRQPIAIGKTGDVKGYIQPGEQTLTGDKLLWYARSRATSDDYSRMARQKCVMNAFLKQASPTEVIKHYEALAGSATALVQTDIPPSEVGRFADLALKAKSQKISTISLVPPLVDTGHPDIDKIQEKIQKTIDSTESSGSSGGSGHKKKHSAPQTSQMTEGSLGNLQDGYVANKTDNLNAAC